MRAWDVMEVAARRHADVQEDGTAEGTVLESRTFKVGGRAFLFLGPKKAYLRLGPSLPRVRQLAATSPAVIPGGAGWTSLLWHEPCPVADAVLRAWVDESRALVASGAGPRLQADLLALRSPTRPSRTPAPSSEGQAKGLDGAALGSR